MSESEQERKKRKQANNLERLFRNNAFEFSETFFPYDSTKIGPYFVQSGDVMKNGRDYYNACLDIALELGECDLITGGETRDWIFSLPVSTITKNPSTMLYENGKIAGPQLKEKEIIHIADLNKDGSSVRDYWSPIIKNRGGKLKEIIFYVDRLEEGTQVLKELGIKNKAIVPMDSYSWDSLLSKGALDKKIYSSLMKRLEDMDAWARDMLRSEKGIDRLIELLNDKELYEKTIKVIQKGYPDLKEEILDRLKQKGKIIELK
ncbi:MAG: hypothetical protein ACP5OG_02815 [Candidatus Nanoarchaeia archaeon]